jgi:hypothetical protein
MSKKRYVLHFLYTITHWKLFHTPTSHGTMATEGIVFQKLSSTTSIYEPLLDAAASTNEGPTTILIFGWMGGKTRSLSRYTTKYNTLYPAARILLVTSAVSETPGLRALHSSRESKQRTEAPAKTLLLNARAEEEKLLIYTFLKGCSMNLASVSKAY